MFLSSKYHKIFLSGLMIVLSFLMLAQAGLAEDCKSGATGCQKALKGLNDTANTSNNYNINPAANNLPTIIGNIIGAVLAFLGVVFFGIILYAGIGWITSMGNEEKINEAKNMIIAAVLGLIVVLGAYAIVNVVGQIFYPATGVTPP